MAYMAGTALEKQPAFASNGFQHQYLNDGSPVIQDVCLSNHTDVQTILIGTTGRGGKAVYALNVSNISNPSTQNLMWEFSDKDDAALGLTTAKPVITKGKNGKLYAVVSSGYNNPKDEGHMFILDINKPANVAWSENTNYWKIRLGKAGVGAPFVYDGDKDGIGDKIFVGDLEGKVWQMDSTTSGNAPFALKRYTGGDNDGALFKPTRDVKPITGAPYAEMVNSKLMVIVGTGRYFSEKDLNSKQQNYAYGLIADGKTEAIPDDENTLLHQEITTNVTSETSLNPAEMAVYSVTENPINETHRGWRLKLLEGTNISADSLIRQRQVAQFMFSRATTEIGALCVRAANSGLVQVDVRNGGRFPKPLVDTNADGKVDKNDANNVGMVEALGVNTSLGTSLTFNAGNGNTPAVYLNDGDRSRLIILAMLDVDAGVRRISWREIF